MALFTCDYTPKTDLKNGKRPKVKIDRFWKLCDIELQVLIGIKIRTKFSDFRMTNSTLLFCAYIAHNNPAQCKKLLIFIINMRPSELNTSIKTSGCRICFKMAYALLIIFSEVAIKRASNGFVSDTEQPKNETL